MARAYFLGRESLGSDENTPADHVRADSPRLSANRNGHHEQAADRILDGLTERWARDLDGNIVRVPRDRRLKAGWVDLGPATGLPPTHGLWLEPACTRGGFEIPSKQHRVALSVPRRSLESKGWTFLGVEDREHRGRFVDADQRDLVLDQLDVQAHEIQHGERRDWSRRPFYDGTERVVPTTNDRDMAPVHKDRIGGAAMTVEAASRKDDK